MMVAIPIILIGFAGYYYFNYYIPQDVQNTGGLQLSQLIPSLFVDTPTVNNTEEVRVEEVVDEKKNKNESSTSTTNTDVSKSSKQPKPTASKSSASTPTTREAPRGQNITYSLILGSFKQENNADRLQQRLQEKGFEVVKFQRGNSLYFVGYEYIDGKSNALRLLTKIKEEESSAWITKKY
jgi:cell division protein FtsN